MLIGVQCTRSTSLVTGYFVETTRATINSTVRITSQIGSARCFLRSKVRLVGTVRNLPARKYDAGQQHRDGAVADHHQDPVAVEWNHRTVGKEVARDRVERSQDLWMRAQNGANLPHLAAHGVLHHAHHSGEHRQENLRAEVDADVHVRARETAEEREKRADQQHLQRRHQRGGERTAPVDRGSGDEAADDVAGEHHDDRYPDRQHHAEHARDEVGRSSHRLAEDELQRPFRKLRADELAAGDEREEADHLVWCLRRADRGHDGYDDDEDQQRGDVAEMREVPPQRFCDDDEAHASPRKMDSRSAVRRRTSMTPAPVLTMRDTKRAMSPSLATFAVTTSFAGAAPAISATAAVS